MASEWWIVPPSLIRTRDPVNQIFFPLAHLLLLVRLLNIFGIC